LELLLYIFKVTACNVSQINNKRFRIIGCKNIIKILNDLGDEIEAQLYLASLNMTKFILLGQLHINSWKSVDFYADPPLVVMK
jgi:hypothetical protein